MEIGVVLVIVLHNLMEGMGWVHSLDFELDQQIS